MGKAVFAWLQITIACLFVLQMPAGAAVFCVDPDADGWIFCTSIQEALTVAESIEEANTIQVVQGIYTGNFSYNSSHGHELEIIGGYTSECMSRETDPANTILDGSGTDRVLDLYDSNGGSITVEGFTVKNGNSGSEGITDYGGGMRVQSRSNDSKSGNIMICNNIVTGNYGFYGGGIYAVSATTMNSLSSSGDVTLKNNIIAGNQSAEQGGGVFARSDSTNASGGTVSLINNTVSGNRAGIYGGGIYVYLYGGGREDGKARLFNNISIGNAASGGEDIYLYTADAETHGYHNNYESMSGSWTYSGQNIDEDPCFVSPGQWDDNGTPEDPSDDFWTEGDYHLRSDSPCIDAALLATREFNVTTDIAPESDFESDPRTGQWVTVGPHYYEKYCDMGADEFTPGTGGAMPWMLLLLD